MSLFRRTASLTAAELIYERSGALRAGGPGQVSSRQARQQSVVWAAGRLRADLISLMPVDCYRTLDGIRVQVSTPPVLREPSEVADGHPMSVGEWLYSGQDALDQYGNNVGVIRAVDGFGLPARIDLVAPEDVQFKIRGGRIVEHRIAGEVTDPRFVWHERQFTTPGLPVGLSPLTYAALSLAAGSAAQRFALDWFLNGAAPSAHLRNDRKEVDPGEADRMKTRFKAAVTNGDIFVSGKDWTYQPLTAKAAESEFLDQMRYTDTDLCRFMGVPADLVDVPVQGSATINYANMTQRNLQLMVMNLGGAVKRRDDALSRVLPRPRFVKLNRAAVLAMDEKSRAELLKLRIEARTLTPDEAREKDDLAPLTEADYAQFDRLFGPRTPNQPQTSGGNP